MIAEQQKESTLIRIPVEDIGWFDPSRADIFEGTIEKLFHTRRGNWILQNIDNNWKVSKEFALVWLLKEEFSIDKIFDAGFIKSVEL